MNDSVPSLRRKIDGLRVRLFSVVEAPPAAPPEGEPGLATVPERVRQEIGSVAAELDGLEVECQELESECRRLAILSGDALHRLTGVLETITDAFYAVDRDWRFTYVNQQAERLMHRSREDLLGRVLWDEFPEAVEHEIYAVCRKAMTEGVSLVHEEFYPPLDAWFDIRLYPAPDGLSILFRDITGQKRAQEREQRLEAEREREERFDLVAQATGDVIWDYDARAGRRWWSDQLSRVFGYTPELAGRTLAWWGERLHPDDRERVTRSIAEALGARESRVSLEYRFRRADGEYAHVLDRMHFLYDEAGELRRSVGVLMDVTEKRREADRSRFSADANAVLIASALDSRARLSLLARVSVPTLADYCLVDVVEGGVATRVAAAHADPEKAHLADALLRFPPFLGAPLGVGQVLHTGEPALVNEIPPRLVERVARDGEHRRTLEELNPRAFLIVPLRARGQTIGAISFVLSDSGRRFDERDRALAEELANHAALAIDNARLHEDVQRASRARQEILRVVSHELRTPLQAITLIEETLRRSLPSSGQDRDRERLETIHRLTGQMTRLVDDLLDVTQIEAGRLRVRPAPEEIASILAEAERAQAPIAREAGIDLSVRLRESLPAVAADRQRALQVLTNLVSNATRATPPGGRIMLSAEADGGSVRVSVADTGPGIPPSDIPHLFDRFWRGREAGGDGAGLGLAIARGIVESHGGRIWLESQVGRGSTFHFTLPAWEGAVGSTSTTPSRGGERASDTESAPAARRRAAATREGSEARRTAFVSSLGPIAAADPEDVRELAQALRLRIVAAVHAGTLKAGDRLPSMRELAESVGASKRAVVKAYACLEQERVTEARPRSGIYVADLERLGDDPPGETARWMVEVLAGACEHQIRLPYLPELLHRWTSAAGVRCACIESDSDSVATLTGEVEHHFGLEAVGVRTTFSREPGSRAATEAGGIPPEIESADILVTTPFHAPLARRWADLLDKPLVVASMNPETAAAVQRHVRHSALTAICVDEGHGERLRLLFDGAGSGRLRILLVPDRAEIDALDPREPVLLTRASREQVQRTDLRLLVPVSPAYCPEFSHHLSRVLLRLNLQLGRS